MLCQLDCVVDGAAADCLRGRLRDPVCEACVGTRRGDRKVPGLQRLFGERLCELKVDLTPLLGGRQPLRSRGEQWV